MSYSGDSFISQARPSDSRCQKPVLCSGHLNICVPYLESPTSAHFVPHTSPDELVLLEQWEKCWEPSVPKTMETIVQLTFR